jgi:hypothetical protein
VSPSLPHLPVAQRFCIFSSISIKPSYWAFTVIIEWQSQENVFTVSWLPWLRPAILLGLCNPVCTGYQDLWSHSPSLWGLAQ